MNEHGDVCMIYTIHTMLKIILSYEETTSNLCETNINLAYNDQPLELYDGVLWLNEESYPM